MYYYFIRPHDKVERKAAEVRKEREDNLNLYWQKELVKAKHDELMMNFQNSQNFQNMWWS